MFKESNKFEKFESKVWLSSPTMHILSDTYQTAKCLYRSSYYSGNCKFLYESYIDSKSRGVWRSNCINCSGNNRNCYSNYILYIKETIECQTDFCALLEVSLIWKYHAIVCRDIENEVLRRYCFIMRSDLYRRIELCWCFINIKR